MKIKTNRLNKKEAKEFDKIFEQFIKKDKRLKNPEMRSNSLKSKMCIITRISIENTVEAMLHSLNRILNERMISK